MKRSLAILPFEKDEALCSHRNRNSPYYFHSTSRYLDTYGRMSMLFPAAIERHCPELVAVKPFSEIYMENTYIPSFVPYLTEEKRSILFAHHAHTPYRGIAHMTGMGRFAKFSGGYLRVCLSCVLEDNGVPVWRRASLLPGILYCPYHEERYVEPCGRCTHGFRDSSASRQLRESCFCGAPLKMAVPRMTENAENASIKVAKFMQFSLDGGLMELNPDRIRAAYKARARKCGIVNSLHITNARIFRNMVRDAGFTELMENLGLRSDSQGLLGKCIRGVSFSANPVLNAIVQSILFSDSSEFLAVAIYGEMEKGDIGDKLRRRVERAKEKIKAVCDEFPEISREGLQSKINSREISLVIKYAPEWLEAKIQRKTRGRNLGGGKKMVSVSHFDERAVKHIERMHVELTSSPDLPRITQRRLLAGLPCASVFNSKRRKLPRATRLLAELTETKEQHSLRRIRTWHSDVAQPELLSHTQRCRLVQRRRGERIDLH